MRYSSYFKQGQKPTAIEKLISVADAEVGYLEKKSNAQLKVDKLKGNQPMIYNYIDSNMPDWAKPTVQKMLNKDLLQGDENGRLNLTDEMLRIFAINDRAGVYGD